LTSIASLVN